MKVLIISHNPLSTFESMGKTLLETTKAFKKEELTQLFIYPSIPNVDRCNSYYRITDKDVLKSFYKFKVKGKVIEPNLDINSNFEDEKDEKIYRNQKNKKPLKMCLRDTMWHMSRWYNKDLKKWLEKEKPDCILAAPGSAKLLYNIAIKISKKLNIPIYSYLCDEFYFLGKRKGLLAKYQLFLQRKKIKTYYTKYVKHVFCICDNLANLYSKEFNVECSTVYTGSSIGVSEKTKDILSINNISFLGNVRCNRYLPLADIGRCIDCINEKNKTNITLSIYTGEKNKEILDSFNSIKCIKLKGFVTGDAFLTALYDSDVLIHTESFGSVMKDIVKNSISTKIADSLASGIPVLAYGPEGLASIDYLKANNVAFCITKEEELMDGLSKLVDSSNLSIINSLSQNALKLARKNHDSGKNSEEIKEIINKKTRNKYEN